jgi:protein gp37
MKGSKISWTGGTWNPWIGCTKCSSECDHCYIDGPSMGFGKRDPWADIYITRTWNDPYTWEKELKDTNHAKRVFTCSLSDFFHAKVDGRRIGSMSMSMHRRAAQRWACIEKFGDPERRWWECTWRDAAWQVIKETPHITYQILTKRPERILNHLPKDWGAGYPNVWLGTSVGCNRTLSKIDSLRKVPAALRFISAEPLLEDISEKINLDGIGWLIVGGESGRGEEYRYDPADKRKRESGRRTMDLGWAYSLYMKANDAGIPFFFKQTTGARSGEGADRLTGKEIHEYPNPPQGLIWMPEPELAVIGQ